MNGYSWKIRFVRANSPMLVDRTRTLTVATTDPVTHTVYLSDYLKGKFLITVLIHELGHCALYSYDLLREIHRMTKPKYWVDMEEFICNFLADYGQELFNVAYSSLGYDAWKVIPAAFDNHFIR